MEQDLGLRLFQGTRYVSFENHMKDTIFLSKERLGQNKNTPFFSMREMVYFCVDTIDFRWGDAFRGHGLSL